MYLSFWAQADSCTDHCGLAEIQATALCGRTELHWGVMFSLEARWDQTRKVHSQTLTPEHPSGANKLLQAHKVFTPCSWTVCVRKTRTDEEWTLTINTAALKCIFFLYWNKNTDSANHLIRKHECRLSFWWHLVVKIARDCHSTPHTASI